MSHRTLTLRKMGGSLGTTFPKEIMDRLHLSDGDKVHCVEKDGGLFLTPFDPDFETAMELYERGARKYRNALRELAK